MTNPRDFLDGTSFSGGGGLTDGQLAKILNLDQTIHFNVGNVGTPSLGTPGTPTPAALALFGQLNIHKDRQIGHIHVHMLQGGAGTLVLEIWRYRLSLNEFTLIATIDADSPADFSRKSVAPTGDLAQLKAGDYLMCQATAAGAVTTGGANGLTVDIHFDDSREG